MTIVIFLLIYGVIVLGTLFGAIQWLKSQRRPKLPFKRDQKKLLRGPGESLHQRIELMDENLIYLLLGLMALPVLAGSGTLVALQSAQVGGPGMRMACALIVTLGVAAAGSYFVAQEGIKRGNHYLGWFGERMTAEELEPLLQQGCRIFHDVPAENGRREFNIDHVVIGLGGVFSIETKMRRKGHARPGRKDHVVRYDGRELSWPWAEDRYGLDQAAQNAVWLRDWLTLLTGERIEVRPILVFPCWFIDPPNAVHPVSVIHTSYLPGFVTLRRDVLTAKQIDLLARQLESRCRDVEY